MRVWPHRQPIERDVAVGLRLVVSVDRALGSVPRAVFLPSFLWPAASGDDGAAGAADSLCPKSRCSRGRGDPE
jgi:hypothetical protein